MSFLSRLKSDRMKSVNDECYKLDSLAEKKNYLLSKDVFTADNFAAMRNCTKFSRSVKL